MTFAEIRKSHFWQRFPAEWLIRYFGNWVEFCCVTLKENSQEVAPFWKIASDIRVSGRFGMYLNLL